MKLAILIASIATLTFAQSVAPPVQPTCPIGYVCTPVPMIQSTTPIANIPAAVTAPAPVAASVTPPASKSTCPSFYAAGAALDRASKPEIAGWFAVGTLFPGTKCGANTGTYSITLHNESLLKNGVIQDSTTTGLAFPFRAFGKVNVMLCGTAGVATAAGTAQSAFSGCAVALIPLWKTGFLVTPWVQVAKGVTASAAALANPTTTYGIGIGRNFGGQ